MKPSASNGDDVAVQYMSQTLPRRDSRDNETRTVRTSSFGSRDAASLLTESTFIGDSPAKTPPNITNAQLMPGREEMLANSRKTPNFTTRRAHSLKKVRQWDDLASIDMHG
jgi:hypothetical protein